MKKIIICCLAMTLCTPYVVAQSCEPTGCFSRPFRSIPLPKSIGRTPTDPNIANQFVNSVGTISCNTRSMSSMVEGTCFYIGNYDIKGTNYGVHVTAGHCVKNQMAMRLQYKSRVIHNPDMFAFKLDNNEDYAVLLSEPCSMQPIPMIDQGAGDVQHCFIGLVNRQLKITTNYLLEREGVSTLVFGGEEVIPGMSGGPVVNANGVVGICNARDPGPRECSTATDISVVIKIIDYRPINKPKSEIEEIPNLPLPIEPNLIDEIESIVTGPTILEKILAVVLLPCCILILIITFIVCRLFLGVSYFK